MHIIMQRPNHHCRQVTVAEAQQLARDWHCVYIESSAKLNQNTGAVFELLLGQIEKAAAGANLDGARGNGGTSDGKKAGCVVM